MDISKKNIGMTAKDGQWHFRIWAPAAKKVQLVLATTQQPINLESTAYGYWETHTKAIKNGDQYWVAIDDKKLPDPASVSQPDGVHGASQAIDFGELEYISNWKNLPLSDYIFYELHTGTFSETGDFEGIAQKLDYLLELGITAIEIMPVASFPGHHNWGYDGVFPFVVQQTYGGPLALKKLISLCHQKGIAVVLDVVYNHLGPEGNYLSEFGPYFTEKYKTPWGNAVNFDDRGSHGVREYFIENVLMWFRDFGVDALRLDAVHAIKDYSATPILQEIRKRTDLLSEQIGRPFYLIAECDLNDPRYISDVERNGLGMHAQWVDEFHHALRVTAGEPKTGYYSDFDGIKHLAKSYRDAYVYTGMYSEERDTFFGRKADGHAHSQFIVFSQNHDQVGNRMLGERSSCLFSFEMQKLMAAAVITAPFLPMLFMGEEWAEENPFLYFIDHTDAALVKLVREGRRNEFAAMHAEGQAPDPKDIKTFDNSKLNWALLDKPQHAVMLAYYKHLIALRKQYFASTAAIPEVETEVFEAKNSLTVLRKSDNETLLLCCLNFSKEAQQLPLPKHLKLQNLLVNSADEQWSAKQSLTKSGLNTIEGSNLFIQPESFIAYNATYV